MHNSAKMEMRGVKGSLEFPLFQTKILGLPHGFGPVYIMPLALNCTSVRLFIHRQMANLRGLYRL